MDGVAAMVALQIVRSSNSDLKKLGSGLVGVFVGATSGIGATTAKEFVRHTLQPTVYLIGRNEEAATKIIGDLRSLNDKAKIRFIRSDISLLKNIDESCKLIQTKEDKVNLLFISAGFARLGGRDETTEGLDKLLNLHYYSRMRFAFNFLPHLNQAAKSGGLSRVVSVLAAGKENNIFLDDLALKKNYGLRSCLNHAATMNSFAAEELAAANPGTTFIHSEPGFVKTNLAKGLGPLLNAVADVFMFVITPCAVPFQESGERHLYEATSNSYPPLSISEESAVIGSNGVKGSGAYLLSWDGAPCGAASIMEEYRSRDAGKLIWMHTLELFERVCGNEKGKY